MRVGRAVSVVLLSVGLLAACGSDSDYRFVNNSQEQTFVKVPKRWKVFNIEVEVAKERPTPLARNPDLWAVVFDGAAKPDVNNFDQTVPTSPVGRVEVFGLSDDNHDVISLSSLRLFSTDFELDPVTAWQNGDQSVELVKYSEITTGTGMRGNRVVFNWRQSDGTWVTVDQTAYIDVTTYRVYRMLVKCESTCFKRNRNMINQIADSFQVRA